MQRSHVSSPRTPIWTYKTDAVTERFTGGSVLPGGGGELFESVLPTGKEVYWCGGIYLRSCGGERPRTPSNYLTPTKTLTTPSHDCVAP